MKPLKNIVDSEQLYLNNNKISQEEIDLWRAVVVQSLDDLLLPPSNNKYRRWRKQAIDWFIKADEDFYSVCEYANLSPRKILELARLNIAEAIMDVLE